MASCFFASLRAAPARAVAVLLTAPMYIEACSRASFGKVELANSVAMLECRGSNQLLLKSKKQWSDQWHDEAKRIRRRNEQ